MPPKCQIDSSRRSSQNVSIGMLGPLIMLKEEQFRTKSGQLKLQKSIQFTSKCNNFTDFPQKIKKVVVSVND